jgi:hypothetical protein
VRERRTINRRGAGRSARLTGAALAPVLWFRTQIVRRPVDSAALLVGVGASLVIVVNALFLQSDPRPAPFLANPAAAQPPPRTAPRVVMTAPAAAPKADEIAPLRSAVGQRPVQPVSARRNDPIADLIGSSVGSPTRVMAVQRVLAEFGYGQIKATGILDEATSVAIEKFESEHKLPVTGRLSERLLTDLAAMTGRPLD